MQTSKHQALADLREALQKPLYRDLLTRIDPRLYDYFTDCVREDIDAANIYELLACRKFLRMLTSYDLDIPTVQRAYKLYEGLSFSGLNGFTQYRLTPLQTYQIAAPFLFLEKQPSTSEPTTEPRSRIVSEANYFVPRKSSKTTLAAFFILYFFLCEDYNAEIYCLANSQDQAKILFNLAKDLIHQIDKTGKAIRQTQTSISWYDANVRRSVVRALTAGGKTKDGLFAQLICADEYGSAGYIKGHSNMANLLQVVEGSTGARLNPLTVITTTAGRVQDGPYKTKLKGIEESLLKELDYPLDGNACPLPTDWQFALLCQPDPWETEEDCQQPYMWRKVNRHLGVTVREDYYRNEWQKMLLDPEKRREQICKLFNLWQNDRVRSWIEPAEIYPLQLRQTIDDLKHDDGWLCFIGCDFSKGDDLNAISYLCYHPERNLFFADMDAWISEDSLLNNPNKAMYKLWTEAGYLRTCPGKTINEAAVTERITEVSEAVTIMRIGYDAYDARRFIHAIGAWVFASGADPTRYLRPVSQSFATYNSVVQELTYMIQNNPPLIRFSSNPMWGWQFGNCFLAESNDGMENVKPIKSSANAKVDNIQALLSALHLYDETQDTIS